MNGLDKITEKILAEAQAEADRILADAQAECDKIRAEAEARAEKIRADLNAEAEREATAYISRARSSAETAKRNLILRTQSDLIDETFDNTLAGMKKLNPEQYTNLLVGLLSAAMLEQSEAEVISRTLYGEEDAMAPDSYEVLMNASDREKYGKSVIDGTVKKLSAKLPREQLSRLRLSDRTVGIDGGLILRCGDIESNCSLALLFAQIREESEADVGHALFDDPKQN